MYRLARLYDGADVLDVGTGPGYGCALLAHRLGSQHVTSVDVDPYLTTTAAARLADCGLHPAILARDACAELPGSYDRIVPMVSLPAIPASWLAALRPGGRLVFSLAASGVVITATKTPDGGATGHVDSKPAWFMADRHGDDYPPRQTGQFATIRDRDGEQVTRGRYPVVEVTLTKSFLLSQVCGRWYRARGSGGESGVADDVVDGGLVCGGGGAELAGWCGGGELGEPGGQDAVVQAGEEHGGLESGVGDAVAAGFRCPVDEMVAA